MSDDGFDALSCQCCLSRRTPQRRLTTPFIHLGTTEIYSEMLKECFDIQLNSGSENCGICSVCVGRLRDASNFKQQVQRSQLELRMRLAGALGIGEEHDVKPEDTVEDGTRDYSPEEPALVKAEPAGDEEDGTRDSSPDEDPSVKSEESDGAPSDEDCISQPREDNTVPPAEPDTNTQPETTPELDPSILNILGDEPAKEEIFGKAIHKDIASRWSDILINGLKEDIWKEMVKSHNIPENLMLARSPLLNPEIKAAVNENAIKRDAILSEKQKLLACAITCIADLMSSTLNKSTDQMKTLKTLSDTGRLLCHIHHSETVARRKFLLACLSKDVKDNIKDLKRDQQLFGTDLSDKLKSMKAITKTGVEMRPTSTKAKPQPKGKPSDASTSRALNWRGPPPPAPRRGYTRPSSTTGGRNNRQPAVTAAARSNTGRRDPKVRSKVMT